MCALIGFKVEKATDHKNKIEEYLKVLQERGDQSFGYIYVTKDKKVYYAKSLAMQPIINSIKKIPEGSWCFLHARKASAGMLGVSAADKLERAHPVLSTDKDILLLHNGTKTAIHDTVYGSVSDSQGLATLLSVMWENRIILAGGIGAVIYERKGKIYLYKDGTRPLVMSEDNTIFASEPVTDKVKWQNIKPTCSPGKGFDVALDFSSKDLGLILDKPVKITYSLSPAKGKKEGKPKTSKCLACKKTHLDLKDVYTMCCTCAIEGVKPKTYTPTTTNMKVKHVKNTVVKEIPKASVVIPKVHDKVQTTKVGVIIRSNISMPADDEVELFTSDVNILKSLGYEGIVFKGWAMLTTNVLYKNTQGVIFVSPDVNGKQKVKVDRVFVKKTNPIFNHEYSTITSKTVRIIGKLNNRSVHAIKASYDLSDCVRDPERGTYPLESIVMKTDMNGEPDVKQSVLIGFRKILIK